MPELNKLVNMVVDRIKPYRSRAVELINKLTGPTTTTTRFFLLILLVIQKGLVHMLTLICQREELLNAINLVNKAVSNRTPNPILECILLTAVDDGLILTGNNLELGIQSATIKAEIKKFGSLALEARIFLEIIRKSNGDTVLISADEQNKTLIKSGSSKFHIPCQVADDFPALPEISKNQCYTLLQCDLKNMIRQTLFSISIDESRPTLTGELFEFTENSITIISVDGYRISYRKGSLISGHNTVSIIVPGKTLAELIKILPGEGDSEIAIYVTDKHILFESSDCIVVSRLIEGEYIKYAQSFPDEFKTQITVDRLELIQSLDRASLFSRDAKKIPVRVDISSGKMQISANSDMGQAEEFVPVELDGIDLTISFNPKYLIDALRVIDDEKVFMEFNTSLSPGTIKPLNNADYKYLILPLRNITTGINLRKLI